MIKNYFKIAMRNLLRTKVYSFINISGLSIGLACCMLILLFTKDEISYDRFHKNGENIYRITTKWLDPAGKVESQSGITGMMPGPAFKNAIPEIKTFVRVQNGPTNVKIGSAIFYQEAIYADDNFFSVFTFPLLYGDKNSALADMHAVVLSEETANRFFGTSNAIGKTLELPLGDKDAFETFVVSGIVPASPQNSSIKIQMLLSMKLNMRPGHTDTQWMNFFLNTFVVLDKNANINKVEAMFKKVMEQNARAELLELKEKYDVKSTVVLALQPLRDMHLSTAYKSDNGLSDASDPMYSGILGAIALFILMIACINFINLTVARSIKRAKEIGIRKVIGSSRKQLIFQFLGESFLLAFFAFLLALLLVQIALPPFNFLVNKSLAFSYLFDIKLIVGYLVIFIVTSLLAGFYPALLLSGFNPVQTLYNRVPSLGKNYLSRGLVIVQFTMATFLIIASITMYTQFNYLSHFDLGYNDKNLVVIRTDMMKADKLLVFKNELQKNPAITAVAARQGGYWGTIAKVDGKQIDFALDVIDTSYFSTLQIPIVQGRNFSTNFPTDSTQSVLVNEAFAKKAGWHDLNNRQVDFFYDSIKYNVIGIVKNYHFASLMEEIKPQLFIMNPKYNYGSLLIKIRPEQTAATLKHIETVFKTRLPFLPFKYDFKETSNAEQYAVDEKNKQMILFAAMLTIFISCIGLFGLATLSSEKRIKEIGIRKVLGASVANIVTILSVGFLKLVLVASLLAFPIAWWVLNNWLQHYPYRITLNSWVFFYAGLTVAFIALCTISVQAIKAAVANPVKNLRSE